MKTLTARLPDSLVLEIERESQSRRVSKSDVVRERLHHPQRAAGAGGNMSDFTGHILEESWKAKAPTRPSRFRSAKAKTSGDHHRMTTDASQRMPLPVPVTQW